MSEMTCMAKGCAKKVPTGVVMCRMHWVMVPSEIQQNIYEQFKADPTGTQYVQALRDAVLAVKDKEDHRRQHAAEERHEFREALALLRRVYDTSTPDSMCDLLYMDLQAFVARHATD